MSDGDLCVADGPGVAPGGGVGVGERGGRARTAVVHKPHTKCISYSLPLLIHITKIAQISLVE